MIISSTRTPELVLTSHSFVVPLDYAAPEGATIRVFAREVTRPDTQQDDLPFLVYFQGGPGSASPRPLHNSGWLKRALQDYRVLLLDQRGTGLSTPVNAASLAGLSASEQATYLSFFRADNIVRDAEFIRKALSPDAPWSILGQSFGGFCVLEYLSLAPEGLKEALITAGIPSLTRPAEDVYRATYPIVQAKNEAFFARYPQAQALCQDIAEYLLRHDVRLPNQQRFTVEQFQQLGMLLGSSTGYEQLYYLLESAFIMSNNKRVLSYAFLYGVFTELSYHLNPIFSLLHEAIYCQNQASNWAAERVRHEFPIFNYQTGKPLYFTGEMIYPWIFEQYNELTPLKDAAQLLAEKTDWPQLYDLNTLKNNRVPVAAVMYEHDMYVPLRYSLETSEQIPNLKTWVTDAYEHNGLRIDGETIVDKLLSMLHTP